MGSTKKFASLLVAASMVLAACSPSIEALEKKCKETYESLVLSVENVENVYFGCNREYHYYTEGGLIEVGDVTRAEALEILDAILKEFARSPDLEDVERPGILLKGSNGSVEVRPGDLGFSEDPNIRELRTHYGDR
jgi:starvation-inducible outer membrane lipoprotein